ncbi:hypothetical protein ABI_29980 [Asticcacaulis biprosthecium C19]|uniref:Uncharacterized protein n=1 Tax=Asticcacaulis biprosthecium C19 TaxID=715226 RepID=F4QMZ0_9CAUL|nr:hypothetical protein ABI_29980 [Asticcacaulis biprosthecium C19]
MRYLSFLSRRRRFTSRILRRKGLHTRLILQVGSARQRRKR